MFNAVFEDNEGGVVDVGVGHIDNVNPCMEIREILLAYFDFVRFLDSIKDWIEFCAQVDTQSFVDVLNVEEVVSAGWNTFLWKIDIKFGEVMENLLVHFGQFSEMFIQVFTFLDPLG